MRIASVIALVLAASFASAAPKPIRVRVRHADPWMLKALFEGRQVQAPEISTLLAMGGPLMLGAAQAATLFQGGHWMVNPTDNSLWFIPDK